VTDPLLKKLPELIKAEETKAIQKSQSPRTPAVRVTIAVPVLSVSSEQEESPKGC